jgi:hypothetical protein
VTRIRASQPAHEPVDDPVHRLAGKSRAQTG